MFASVVASLLTAPTQAASQPVTKPAIFQQGLGIVSPVLLKEVKPRYTKAAKEAKIQGTVTLECVVLPAGRVGDVKVIKSLHPELDRGPTKYVGS